MLFLLATSFFSIVYFVHEIYVFPRIANAFGAEYSALESEEEIKRWDDALANIEYISSVIGSNFNSNHSITSIDNKLTDIQFGLTRINTKIENNIDLTVKAGSDSADNPYGRKKPPFKRFYVTYKQGSLILDYGFMKNREQLSELIDYLKHSNNAEYNLLLIGSSSSESIANPDNRISDNYSLSKARANSLMGSLIQEMVREEINMPKSWISVGDSNEKSHDNPSSFDRRVDIYLYSSKVN